MNIHDLPMQQRPREKLAELGIKKLSDIDLVQILLGFGVSGSPVCDVAENVLSKCLYKTDIKNLSVQELMTIKGIGETKAAVILAAVELGLRLLSQTVPTKQQIKSPKEVFELLKVDFLGATQEKLYLLTLDSRNKLIAKDLIHIGGLSYLSVSPRDILSQTLKRSAAAIIISHNHPSGDFTPSKEDIDVSKKVMFVCEQLGVSFVDHVIVSDSGYSSLKALGYLLDASEQLNLEDSFLVIRKGGENFEYSKTKS